jgi:hypothetical protein
MEATEEELDAILVHVRDITARKLLLAVEIWQSTTEWWIQKLYEEGPPEIDLRIPAAADCLMLQGLLERLDALS